MIKCKEIHHGDTCGGPPKTDGFGGQIATACAKAAGANYCTETQKKIYKLVSKYSYILKYVALLNPGALYQMYGVNLDNNFPEPAPDEYWRSVVAQLGLSSKQVGGGVVF